MSAQVRARQSVTTTTSDRLPLIELVEILPLTCIPAGQGPSASARVESAHLRMLAV